MFAHASPPPQAGPGLWKGPAGAALHIFRQTPSGPPRVSAHSSPVEHWVAVAVNAKFCLQLAPRAALPGGRHVGRSYVRAHLKKLIAWVVQFPVGLTSVGIPLKSFCKQVLLTPT